MTSRILQSLLGIGRIRAGAGINTGVRSRQAFSTQISRSYAEAPVGPVNALVRMWYNLYVIASWPVAVWKRHSSFDLVFLPHIFNHTAGHSFSLTNLTFPVSIVLSISKK